MPDRLTWGNAETGLSTGLTAFNIDNDAFQTLQNAYIWRQRLKRKRGTQLLGRLEIQVVGVSIGNTSLTGTIGLNIFSTLTIPATYQLSIPGFSVTVNSMPANIYTDPLGNGDLVGSVSGTGTIDYITGDLAIIGSADSTAATITFNYYPSLPVLGLEDFEVGAINQPQLVAFDTTYSYQFNQGTNHFFNVNFYKSTGLPFFWHSHIWQQFYSANYLGITTIQNKAQNTGCMWVTNGNPGWHITTITALADQASTTTLHVTLANTTLVVGDYLFFNEVQGAVVTGLNGSTGKITTVTSPGVYIVTFPSAVVITTWTSPTGLVELMTSSVANKDGIRWYDGIPTTAPSTFGWVNFAPPLSAFDATLNTKPFYLVGADIITPFKNRLLFSGVYLAQSNATTPVYYPNRVVYSQVGLPFYAAPLPSILSTTAVPDPEAWYQNVAGKGGFQTAPIDEEIISVSDNEDVLIYIMETQPLKLVFQFDDSLPFFFQTISPEYGGQSTFSAVPLDRGVLSIGEYGFLVTDQIKVGRIDLKIPDQVFDISISTSTNSATNNSASVTAHRDYRNEWVYFTYIPGKDETTKVFPSRTVLFNYRDNNFAIFDENYTHYGTFRRTTTQTWASLPYKTWAEWLLPWNSAEPNANFPQVVGGNHHGFVMIRWDNVQEDNSQYISAINVSTSRVTSPNHCLNPGDFIQINNAAGIATHSANGIYQISIIDANTFQCSMEPGVMGAPFTGDYIGGGVYKRYSIPQVQSKQYQPYWEQGKGVKVGVQKYLLDTTASGQITAEMFTSQNNSTNLNDNQLNSYQTSTNIVLTTTEPNLYGDTTLSRGQSQTWHRMSNSFKGDTVQWGITLSGSQMYDVDINEQEIILHSVILDVSPSGVLSV